MEFHIGTKKDIPKEFIVEYNRLINNPPLIHSITVHNANIDKYGAMGCPLCYAGSRIAHGSIIEICGNPDKDCDRCQCLVLGTCEGHRSKND